MKKRANLPHIGKKRVVIIGCGFAGLKLAKQLKNSDFQIIIIDKFNYHQFQPLYYQVATAGLEPSAIAFPLRKIFQGYKNVFIRIAEAKRIKSEEKIIETSLGIIRYDYLVLSMGAGNNFFGNANLEKYTYPMKSVSESLNLRNTILQTFEDALSASSEEDKESLLNMVVIGGGPTGVEISGALADMKKYVLPKDYSELDVDKIKIYLIEGSQRLLNGMSDKASEKSAFFLKKMGVEIITNVRVNDYDGKTVKLNTGEEIKSRIVIWAAGISANIIEGLDETIYEKGNRIKVDRMNRISGYNDIFCIGDMAFMQEGSYQNGHPQIAPVAVKQAKILANNLIALEKNRALKEFNYSNLGTMATIGRNLAVVDLPYIRFQGIFAWFFWMFIHLMSIVGVKNKVMIFINWMWNYVTYDQSLRLIMRANDTKTEKET